MLLQRYESMKFLEIVPVRHVYDDLLLVIRVARMISTFVLEQWGTLHDVISL